MVRVKSFTLQFCFSFFLYSVAPWLDKPKQDLEFERFKGENVSFECGAKGFPLQPVEWKFQKIGDESTLSFKGAFINHYFKSLSTEKLWNSLKVC